MTTSFAEYLARHSWLTVSGRPCVSSPDIDGLLCALMAGSVLNWECVGFYDGNQIALWANPRRVVWRETVFLDVEILRPDVRSLGNHLLTFDAEDAATLERSCPGLMNPNLWRGIHFQPDFGRKYPFGTLPILYSALAFRGLVQPDPRHLGALYYPDSGLENAMVYKDNALDWLWAMGAEDPSSPLAPLCRMVSGQTVYGTLKVLSKVQELVARAGFGRREKAARFDPEQDEGRRRAANLARLLSDMTGWHAPLPLDSPPDVVMTFETRRLPLDAKGRASASFRAAREMGALSLAATGRSAEGLSLTVPPRASPRFLDIWFQ